MITVVEFVEETKVSIRISDEVKRRVDLLIAQGKCLGCEEVPSETGTVRCGQCDRCYNRSLRRIERREVTRTELIRKGMMLPPGKPGPKPDDRYTQKLAEL